jgi:hypothetical protein
MDSLTVTGEGAIFKCKRDQKTDAPCHSRFGTEAIEFAGRRLFVCLFYAKEQFLNVRETGKPGPRVTADVAR